MKIKQDGTPIMDDYELVIMGKAFIGLRCFSAFKEKFEDMDFLYFIQKYGDEVLEGYLNYEKE